MYSDGDLIGNRFGKIIVKKYYDNTKYGKRYLCQCDCGNTIIRQGTLIWNNRVHSCGCQRGKWNRGKTHNEQAKSHIGEKYNKLTIIDFEKSKNSSRSYLMVCQCDCGNITKQIYADIVSGKVKSCGCYQKEQASKTGSNIGLENIRKNTNYVWYFIKDNQKIYCRSGYEVIYANWLISNNISFSYEEKTFKLDNGRRYTPDFHLLDTDEYVEIKGTFNTGTRNNQKENIQLFQKNHKHKVMYWTDIVNECNLQYKTYSTYIRHSVKSNIKAEDYLGQYLYAS